RRGSGAPPYRTIAAAGAPIRSIFDFFPPAVLESPRAGPPPRARSQCGVTAAIQAPVPLEYLQVSVGPPADRSRSQMDLEDKVIVCQDCKKEFTHTVEDQKRYTERGFIQDPKRCAECRQARKDKAAAKKANPRPSQDVGASGDFGSSFRGGSREGRGGGGGFGGPRREGRGGGGGGFGGGR